MFANSGDSKNPIAANFREVIPFPCFFEDKFQLLVNGHRREGKNQEDFIRSKVDLRCEPDASGLLADLLWK